MSSWFSDAPMRVVIRTRDLSMLRAVSVHAPQEFHRSVIHDNEASELAITASRRTHPRSLLQGSGKPALDSPSDGLLSESIHSSQTWHPRDVQSNNESSAKRAISWRLLPALMSEANAQALSMKYMTSLLRRSLRKVQNP